MYSPEHLAAVGAVSGRGRRQLASCSRMPSSARPWDAAVGQSQAAIATWMRARGEAMETLSAPRQATGRM